MDIRDAHAGNTISLDKELSTRAKVEISPEEHPDERSARLATEARDATFNIVRRYVTLLAVVLMGGCVFGVAVYEAALDPSATAETKRWAQTVLSSIFTGFVGYIVGSVATKSSR